MILTKLTWMGDYQKSSKIFRTVNLQYSETLKIRMEWARVVLALIISLVSSWGYLIYTSSQSSLSQRQLELELIIMGLGDFSMELVLELSSKCLSLSLEKSLRWELLLLMHQS